MTIQISLVIWTIIGFTVLAFVLNRFLFKPMLKVMDDRNEKIKAAEAEKQAELERREKTLQAMELSNRAREQEALKAAEKEVDAEHKKTEAILAEKKAEYDEALEKLRQDYENDTNEAEENLSESIDKLALKYVKTQIL